MKKSDKGPIVKVVVVEITTYFLQFLCYSIGKEIACPRIYIY